MNGFNFKKYGQIDIQPLQEKILNAGFNWDDYQYRQQNYAVHRETQTIPLLWNERDFLNLKCWENYLLFKDEIDKIETIIEDTLSLKGTVHTAILIKLKKKARIYPHFDHAPFFKSSKRIHVPVFTNPDCFFTVDSEIINMKEGEIWEINNTGKLHGVENKGTTDRIHLLIDWRVNK